MRRDETVCVRFSEFERDLVERAAAERHLRVGEYLRLLAREATQAGPRDVVPHSKRPSGSPEAA